MVFFRKFLFLSLVWSLFLGISLSCQKKDPSGSHTYLIPWPNAAGTYKLQAVTIETLNSPYVMDGTSAKVYSDQGFENKNLAGNPARPRLSEVDGVYVPQDPSSSLAVTVYAHFENLKRMEELYKLPTQMDWPRSVGIGVPVRLPNGKGEFNNARYFAPEDVVGITPYQGKGIPLALNAGILAHEHFHAIFERLFMPAVYEDLKVEEHLDDLGEAFIEALNKDPNESLATTASGSESEKVTRESTVSHFVENQLVLRAWNEGLADFFAYVYTGDADFMKGSIAAKTRTSRRLDGELKTLLSPFQLTSNMNLYSDSGECPSGFCMAYSEGTKLSRYLFRIWNQLPQSSRPEFLREIFMGLPVASKALVVGLRVQSLSLNSIVPYLVKGSRIKEANSCKQTVLLMGNSQSLFETYSECREGEIEP